MPKRGGTTNLPEEGGTPNLPGIGGTCVPNVEEDEISVGDWSQAFLQAVGYDPDGPPKFVSYRPYRGATLRIFRLLGSLYGMSQAPMDWYKTLHNWLVLEVGFVRSENDKAMWMHPTRRLNIGSHVDDCILRGKRKHHTWFWTEANKKFNAPCARHASLCPRGLGLGVCSSFAPAALALVSSANWKFNWAPFFIK